MIGRLSISAVMVLLLLAELAHAADKKAPAGYAKAESDQTFGDIQARTNGEPVLLAESQPYGAWTTRFGWWAFWNTGSPAKVGEYQDVAPSPFWDVDGFSSDGFRTLAVTATGNDNETTAGNLYFYRPGITATLDYNRYPHRRDHDPLDNFAPLDPSLPNNPGGNDPLVMKQDLNVGEDYAVRVQELKGSIKGIYADDNVKVRLDVWGLKKEGTRQANLTAMCYNRNVTGANIPPDHLGVGGANLGTFRGARCHVLSQSQHIDWTTTEIKPVVEVHFGDMFTVEYSRPMRGFAADDQVVSRFYNVTGSLTFNPTSSNNPPLNLPNNQPYATGVVADNYTEMDQLKISGDLSEDTKAYAFLMAGHNVNREIDMTRWFNNVDMRVTNTSLESTTLTAYGRVFNEAEQMPSLDRVVALELDPTRPGAQVPYNNTRTRNFLPTLDAPINYHNTTTGLKGVWRPGGCGFDRGGFAFVAGYEYGDLERANAIFDSDEGDVTLNDSRTITHGFQIGPNYRWSQCFDTHVRYKFQDAEQPLIGFKPLNGTFNTILPQQDHIVELGCDWYPSDAFLMNVSIGFERADNHSAYADFNEENYPINVSAWWAVSERLSLTGGYAVFSNFVAQDIMVGDDQVGAAVPPVTGRWNYGGRAQVVTIGSRYCLTERVRLTGDVEWVRGHNRITNSTMLFPSGTLVTDLGTFSEVLNETTRLRLGFDWVLRPRMVVYSRYELYNFDDFAPGFQSGVAQGILGGFSALF